MTPSFMKDTTTPEKHSFLSKLTNEIREIVFGLGDGLVSTLGAVTGIAGATLNSHLVILTGLIVIAVEALSMSVGEYLSSKSEKEVWERRVSNEQRCIAADPAAARCTLEDIYRRKGLNDQEVTAVATVVMQHPEWVLNEMAVHKLSVSPVRPDSPVGGAVFMFFAYAAGGIVPLLPYFFLDISNAIVPSIVATAIALFTVGAVKGQMTTKRWIASGLEMAILSLVAAGVGLLVGRFVVSLQ